MESRKSSDWKTLSQKLGRKGIEVVLPAFSFDFVGSHKKMTGQKASKVDKEFQNLRKSVDRFLKKYKNNLQQGEWVLDGKIVIFKDVSQALSVAKKVIKNRLRGNIKLDLRIAIHYGKMIFRKKVGDISCLTLTITERIQKNRCKKNSLIITSDFYNELEQDDKKGFRRSRKIRIKKPNTELKIYAFSFEKQSKITN